LEGLEGGGGGGAWGVWGGKRGRVGGCWLLGGLGVSAHFGSVRPAVVEPL
jgi:hypothetical protein